MILFRDNIAVVNPNAEINRLRELMPASARDEHQADAERSANGCD